MTIGVCVSRLFAAAFLVVMVVPVASASVQSELAFHRGVVAFGEDRLDEAKQQFEKVVAEDAEDTTALSYLGLIAQKQDDPKAALDYFDRALAIDPDDAETQLDRGIALMGLGRIDEAQQAFARSSELAPDNARAKLFSGIAAYRSGDHEGAKPHFVRAAELDPELVDESRYYTGLSETVLGNFDAASASFAAAAEQSPLTPLALSATNFQQQLVAAALDERPWRFQMTGGMEYDSNPLILGESVSWLPDPDGRVDGRGVIRMRGDYAILAGDWGSVTAGYDGYYSFHLHDTEVNLQTQNPWISGGYELGLFRLGLRYDFSYTFIDTSESFRMLNRVTPSVSMHQGDWGVSYLYYQYYAADFYNDPSNSDIYELSGDSNLVGLNQFFFFPDPPFSYVRIGVAGEWLRTDGTEWSSDGIQALAGAGYDFDYEIAFSWLYRFDYRDYQNPSDLSDPDFPRTRKDYRHSLTLALSKTINHHWEVSLSAALTWNESNVKFYQYDRQVGGGYVTYHF
ncbi:MAG: tetratricopeptide repeat protein [Myxococcota bacterium]|nr:tetratricopeptide repeat protein [bacterium]MDP6075578.1 tetratricopeptide repeat protein [Myxococcota bacterium]MDP6244799.1 tetratricopeptide repeat protein [Myxococcota bacterium]MDP7076301.1 tetratricopeptide repeat protein [Myxococcota bacterium]MDP7299117.1 tetratricopeptide repeat protein [Myxococcota bacterium]